MGAVEGIVEKDGMLLPSPVASRSVTTVAARLIVVTIVVLASMAPARADLIGTGRLVAPEIVGVSGTNTFGLLSVIVGSAVLFSEVFNVGDPNRDITLVTNPAFGLGAVLTNGTDDWFGFSATTTFGAGASGGLGLSESMVFAGSLGLNGVDFLGSTIDRVELMIANPLSVPGRDPNGDGQWLDFNIDASIRIYGTTAAVSEPSAPILFALCLFLGLAFAHRGRVRPMRLS